MGTDSRWGLGAGRGAGQSPRELAQLGAAWTVHGRPVSSRLLTRHEACLMTRPWEMLRVWLVGHLRDQGGSWRGHGFRTIPEHRWPACSTLLTSLGQGRVGSRPSGREQTPPGRLSHVTGAWGWGHQRETGRGWPAQAGGRAATAMAGALFPACGGQRAGPWWSGHRGRGGRSRGASQKARHLSACCSSRSTASARLSTYPSAFTSGWRSSLGLQSRAAVSQSVTPC